MSATMSLTGALFSTISPTPAIDLVEAGGDLPQRDDRRDEVVDEREHDQQDREQHDHAGAGISACASASSTITSSEPP